MIPGKIWTKEQQMRAVQAVMDGTDILPKNSFREWKTEELTPEQIEAAADDFALSFGMMLLGIEHPKPN